MGMYRRKGRWWMDITVNGRRIRKSLGQRDRDAAKLMYQAELRGFETFAIKKDPTVAELRDTFKDYCATNVSESTQRRYKDVVANFEAFVRIPETFRASKIDRRLVEQFKAWRIQAGAKPVTLSIELRTLKRMFNVAIRLGVASENPFLGVELPRCESNLPKFLTSEEVTRVLAIARDQDANPIPGAEPPVKVYPIIVILLNTGIREGELLSLTWHDVDLDKGKIRIVNQSTWKTKTRKELIVDLNLDARRAFRMLTLGEPSDQVVALHSYSLWRKVRKILRKAGLKGMKVHSLRHTFASHLIMNGVDINTVKELLGHASIATTQIYAHLSDQHRKAAVQRLSFETAKDARITRIDRADSTDAASL